MFCRLQSSGFTVMHLVYVVYNADADGSVIGITRRQAEDLVVRGHRVTLISNSPGISWSGIHSVHIPVCDGPIWSRLSWACERYSARVQRWLPALSLRRVIEQFRFPLSAAHAITELNRNDHIDGLICCQHRIAQGLYAVQQSLKLRVMLVAHGDIFEHPRGAFSLATIWLYRWAAVGSYRQADRVVAVSHKLAERAIEKGASPERVTVVYNGIDVAEIGGPSMDTLPRKADIELLVVGRLSHEKGIDILLEAIPLLKNASVRVRLVGEGDARPALQRQARNLRIVDRVEFIGGVPRATLSALYRSCDLVVMPSRSDAMPLVALEAMTCGRPVLATRVGGIPEVIDDGVQGRLVPPEDPSALAKAIDELFENPTRRISMAEAAVARAAKFDWPQVLDQFHDAVLKTFSQPDILRK